MDQDVSILLLERQKSSCSLMVSFGATETTYQGHGRKSRTKESHRHLVTNGRSDISLLSSMHVTEKYFAVTFESPAAFFRTTEMMRFEAVWMRTANSRTLLTTQSAFDMFPPIYCLDNILPLTISHLYLGRILCTVIVCKNLPSPSLESKK
jgi:hypothetical protein